MSEPTQAPQPPNKQPDDSDPRGIRLDTVGVKLRLPPEVVTAVAPYLKLVPLIIAVGGFVVMCCYGAALVLKAK